MFEVVDDVSSTTLLEAARAAKLELTTSVYDDSLTLTQFVYRGNAALALSVNHTYFFPTSQELGEELMKAYLHRQRDLSQTSRST